MNKLISLLFLIALPSFLYSHGGGLDAQGGHNDRKNGGYHCHRAPCGQAEKETKTKSSKKYKRKDWAHWSDLDGDCMNTRHEMLLEQADGEVHLSPDRCFVSTGTWLDPFSGKILHRASDLDVDHIIPLKWAHDHGGASWSKIKKEKFANDRYNLLVVDDGLNQSKGAKGPSEWMPPNHEFRCEYLHLWASVLASYNELEMTSSEKRVFVKQRNACGI